MSRGEGELLTVPKPRAVSLLSVYLAVKPVGEPDAGDRHVRFDERGWETERCRMAQATAPILDSTETDLPTVERDVRPRGQNAGNGPPLPSLTRSGLRRRCFSVVGAIGELSRTEESVNLSNRLGRFPYDGQ